MDVRVNGGKTPEERIAAVVVSILRRTKSEDLWKLDRADFEEELRPYIRREIIQGKLDELSYMIGRLHELLNATENVIAHSDVGRKR